MPKPIGASSVELLTIDWTGSSVARPHKEANRCGASVVPMAENVVISGAWGCGTKGERQGKNAIGRTSRFCYSSAFPAGICGAHIAAG